MSRGTLMRCDFVKFSLMNFFFDSFFDHKKEFYDFDYEAVKYRDSSKLSNGI